MSGTGAGAGPPGSRFGGLSPVVAAHLIARAHDDMASALVVAAAALLTLPPH